MDFSSLVNYIFKLPTLASACLGETPQSSLMRKQLVQHCAKFSKKVNNRTSGFVLYNNQCKTLHRIINSKDSCSVQLKGKKSAKIKVQV